jgi:bile acid:Na+ symporter, BASS family
MQQNSITDVFLPIALGIIMLGLGLGLTLADFRRVVVYPRAVAIGLACQMLILPVVCLGIAHAFALPPELAVGLMLLAASPGGAVANLFSHLSHGDVALNVTITAVNSVLSLITLPLIVQFSLAHFLGETQQIPLQFSKVISVVLVVLVPVALGMVVRAHRPAIANRLDRPVRVLSALFLLGVTVSAMAAERDQLGAALAAVGPAAITFNILSLAVGYFIPRLARVERRQAIAIGMEIGIHNAILAIAVALNVLGSPTMAIAPGVYSLSMLVTAAVFGFLVSRSRG